MMVNTPASTFNKLDTVAEESFRKTGNPNASHVFIPPSTTIAFAKPHEPKMPVARLAFARSSPMM